MLAYGRPNSQLNRRNATDEGLIGRSVGGLAWPGSRLGTSAVGGRNIECTLAPFRFSSGPAEPCSRLQAVG